MKIKSRERLSFLYLFNYLLVGYALDSKLELKLLFFFLVGVRKHTQPISQNAFSDSFDVYH